MAEAATTPIFDLDIFREQLTAADFGTATLDLITYAPQVIGTVTERLMEGQDGAHELGLTLNGLMRHVEASHQKGPGDINRAGIVNRYLFAAEDIAPRTVDWAMTVAAEAVGTDDPGGLMLALAQARLMFRPDTKGNTSAIKLGIAPVDREQPVTLPPAFKRWVTLAVEEQAHGVPHERTEHPEIPLHDLDELLRRAGTKALEYRRNQLATQQQSAGKVGN